MEFVKSGIIRSAMRESAPVVMDLRAICIGDWIRRQGVIDDTKPCIHLLHLVTFSHRPHVHSPIIEDIVVEVKRMLTGGSLWW